MKLLTMRSLEDILIWRENARLFDKTLVFTNGCFDILHIGHVQYLQEAKSLGDLLIVGLNSDSSVQKIKGDKRPIQTQSDRYLILKALSCVDEVICFDEETPVRLIEHIQPDIHVKGGDYTAADLPETPVVEAYGGRVKILSFLEGRSTSDILKRI